MPRFIESLSSFYQVLLRLYPMELRERYPNEMTAVFSQSFHDVYLRAGRRGVALTCARALGQFFTVALPRHLTSDWLIVASLSLAMTACILGSLIGVMMARHPIRVSGNGVVVCR